MENENETMDSGYTEEPSANSKAVETAESTGAETTATDNVEEKNPTELVEKGEQPTANLFGDNQQQLEEEDFIDFENNESVKDFKDIFKHSKISEREYNQFINKINESTTGESFAKSMLQEFKTKEEMNNQLSLFKEATKNFYTQEQQQQLEKYPAEVKVNLLKLANHLYQKQQQLEKEYGLTTANRVENNNQFISSQKAQEEYEKITLQMLNEDKTLSTEQYKALMDRRKELEKFF